MALTAEQLDAAISALVTQMADGVQSIRYPDGSGVTYIDAAAAPGLLRTLRVERAALAGTVRGRFGFFATVTNRG